MERTVAVPGRDYRSYLVRTSGGHGHARQFIIGMVISIICNYDTFYKEV